MIIAIVNLGRIISYLPVETKDVHSAYTHWQIILIDIGGEILTHVAEIDICLVYRESIRVHIEHVRK
jgi:hypothetical protein